MLIYSLKLFIECKCLLFVRHCVKSWVYIILILLYIFTGGNSTIITIDCSELWDYYIFINCLIFLCTSQNFSRYIWSNKWTAFKFLFFEVYPLEFCPKIRLPQGPPRGRRFGNTNHLLVYHWLMGCGNGG